MLWKGRGQYGDPEMWRRVMETTVFAVEGLLTSRLYDHSQSLQAMLGHLLGLFFYWQHTFSHYSGAVKLYYSYVYQSLPRG